MLLHSSEAPLQTHNQGLQHPINSLAVLQSIKQEFLIKLHSILNSVYIGNLARYVQWGETEAKQMEFLSVRESYTASALHL